MGFAWCGQAAQRLHKRKKSVDEQATTSVPTHSEEDSYIASSCHEADQLPAPSREVAARGAKVSVLIARTQEPQPCDHV